MAWYVSILWSGGKPFFVKKKLHLFSYRVKINDTQTI